MQLRISFFLLCYCIYENNSSGIKSPDEAEVTKYKRLSHFEIITHDLLDNNWNDDEKPCLSQLLNIIGNVQNSTVWAAWIWDSIQTPVGQLYGTKAHLGNYDQCLDLPWKKHPKFRTQYCLAEMNLYDKELKVENVNLLGPLQDFMKLKTRNNLKYNTLNWGICVPAICKPESVAKFAKVLFRSTHLNHLESGLKISVNPEFCRVAGEVEDRTFGDNFVLSMIAFSTALTLLCTWYVSFRGDRSNATGLQFAKALDIRANVASLMDNPEDCVGPVLGIRIISLALTFMGHFNILKIAFSVSTGGKYNKKLDTTMLSVFYNVEMVIDTFLMISGLLWIKGLMHKGVRPFDPIKVLAKRYIRFMWPVVLILLVLPQIFTPPEPGPLTRKFLKIERESCSSNWWKVLLLVATYTDQENMCYPTLWTVLCDLHICIVGTIIYWIYVKNRRAGIQVFSVVGVASIIMPMIHAYTHNKPAAVKFDFLPSENFRTFFMTDTAYALSHNRAGPYFVGMAVGYLLSVYKPIKYRNFLSKKMSVLGFTIFLVMFTYVNYITYTYYWRKSGALESAVVLVMRRVIWAVLIGFLIIICEYGTVPLVTGFLSWSVWVPLSKLTYGIYLTHFGLMQRMVAESRAPYKQDFFEDIIIASGMFFVSTVVSLFMWIFLEIPIINLIFNNSKSAKNINGNNNIEVRTQYTDIVDTDISGRLQKKVS